ncbi:hypothetical protein D3C81_583910 [compost metagenome]
MTTPTHILDGNDKSKLVDHGDMDEAIAEDNPASPDFPRSRYSFFFELFDLYDSGNVHIQRKLTEARDLQSTVATCDEVLVWLKTSEVKLSLDTDIMLEVDGQPFAIRQASPEQRLTLQFMDREAPQILTEDFSAPLRVDGNASPGKNFEITAIDHLYLFGTPQFQARMFEQLALLAGYPELSQLLDTARQQYETVPEIVIMQLHAGTPQYGPGFDMRAAIPARYSHLLTGNYTVVLFDPYASNGLDALTTLTKMLQEAYSALTTGLLIPGAAPRD